MSSTDARRRRIEGCLLGTAVGDALGLPCEGLSSRVIARRFLPLERYQLFGARGFVSDDTEQTALVAQALCRRADGKAAVLRAFRTSLKGWFLRLPSGIGKATIRACVRLWLGFERSGVDSAGNGSAMRSAVLGALFFDDRAARVFWARAFSEVTHTDARAIEAAVFCAHVAAGEAEPVALVDEPRLREALTRASALAADGASVELAARTLGAPGFVSGFVLHSVPFAWFCFARFGATFEAIERCIEAGGDTDTNAAIVGAWVGSHAPEQLPARLVDQLAGGPFGADHLRKLASALASGGAAPQWSWLLALIRNALLFPVVLAHGFRRLVPW